MRALSSYVQHFLLVWAMLFTISPARAQDDTCVHPTIQFSLVNQLGHPLTDLSSSQFVATYRGKPVKILSVTPVPGPRRVLILIDASRSMESTHNVDFNIADELLDQLSAGTEIAVVAFAQETTATPGFTTDRETVRKELHVFRSDERLTKSLKNHTALFETINRSASIFGTPQPGDILYVISDGQDNASEIKWQSLDEDLLQRGVRLFAFRIEWTASVPMLGLEDTFPKIISSTGGMAVVLPVDSTYNENEQTYSPPLRDPHGKKLDLAVEIDMQTRLMLNLNKMQIELPEPPRGKRELELRLAKKSPDLFLVFQHTLASCSGDIAVK